MLADPSLEVEALLTTLTREYDRISVHGVRRSLLHEQVRALVSATTFQSGAAAHVYRLRAEA